MKQWKFGEPVVVGAVAHRVIRNDADFNRKHPDESEPVRYHERGTEISPEIAESVAWPDRNGLPYARIVREVLDPPVTGLVVGHTYRQEGYRDSGSGLRGSGWYDEPDYEPPSFVPTKVVRLVEVALTVGPRQKARIVLAYREDLGSWSEEVLKQLTDAVYQPLLVAAGMSPAEAATNVLGYVPEESA